MSRFLVTTALESTWPANDEPVVFLGEWCRKYSKKAAWEKLDALVALYHWDDRQKLHTDYEYIQELYEKLLIELSAKLNTIHGVNHSVRYWRIIVGPWLGYFIQILFDRWVMLQQAMEDQHILGARLIQRNQEDLIPNDMSDFDTLYVKDDWNELICGQILSWMKIPVEIISKKKSLTSSLKKIQILNPFHRLKTSLAQMASNISGLMRRDNEYFFISSYLGVKQDFLLQLKLRQIPKFWRSAAMPKGRVDMTIRKWSLETVDSNADFSILAGSLISKNIPIGYLEGYQNVVTLTERLPWPKKPKAIFTSNSYSSDDVFKVWAAGKVENSTPLLIGQHGGNDGVALWSFVEDHQIAIGDCFLTWGWSKSKQDKIIPVGIFKSFGKKIASDKVGKALMVEMTLPQTSYHMYSVPVAAGQWGSYFEDQCRFVEALPQTLRDQLLVRLFARDHDYSQKERWKDRFPTLQLDTGKQSINSLMSKARIYISTYNATTYLESMSLNFPTIIFWNPKHWELREDAIPYFEQLKSVGIFHETPEGAAIQMAMIWDNVSNWWEDPVLQAVRRDFCERFARIPDQPLDVMAKVLREVVKAREPL